MSTISFSPPSTAKYHFLIRWLHQNDNKQYPFHPRSNAATDTNVSIRCQQSVTANLLPLGGGI
jgi:hypothetical protein